MLNKISNRIYEQIKTSIYRPLTKNSRVLVKEKEVVSVITNLAIQEEDAGEKVINIASILEVKPQEIGKYLLVEEGSKVLKGEIVARKDRTITSREKYYLTPMDGVFEKLTDQGEFVLRYSPRTYKLNSQVEGVVKSITDSFIELEITADVIKGVHFIGKDTVGLLDKFAAPNEVLKIDKLDSRLAGKIIFGGNLITSEFIERAAHFDVKGIICGGISASDYKKLTKQDNLTSILILEGYGEVDVSNDFFDLLIRREKRQGFLVSSSQTLIIPLLGSGKYLNQKAPQLKELKVNDQVWMQHMGQKRQFGVVLSTKKMKSATKPSLAFQAKQSLRPSVDGLKQSPLSDVTVQKLMQNNKLLQTETALVKLESGREIETFASNLEIVSSY